MDIFHLIKTRRSIRKFQKKPIPRPELEKIIQAGTWAPSSMNLQPWRFVVVSDPDALKLVVREARVELARYLRTPDAEAKYGKANCERFMPRAEGKDELFYGAPTILFIVDPVYGGKERFDYGLAAQNMMLMAHDLGLGSCCIGLSEPLNHSKKIRDLFGLRTNETLLIAIVLGYPAESPSAKKRKIDVVTWI